MISFPAGRPSGAIAEDGSWRFRQGHGRGTKGHHEISFINREKPCVAQTCLRNTKGTVLLWMRPMIVFFQIFVHVSSRNVLYPVQRCWRVLFCLLPGFSFLFLECWFGRELLLQQNHSWIVEKFLRSGDAEKPCDVNLASSIRKCQHATTFSSIIVHDLFYWENLRGHVASAFCWSKTENGRTPISRGNYINHHRPSTNVDSTAFPQKCQITRVRGRPKRS